MGAAGSDTALEVADIALMDEDLAKLPELVSLGRRTMSVIRQNIILAIGVKLLFAILVFPGYVTLWMAVAIGDMGISLTVIANALRLTRNGDSPPGGNGRSSSPSIGVSKGTAPCLDSCCAGGNDHDDPGEVLSQGAGSCKDGCCSGEESGTQKDAGSLPAPGSCQDGCCGDDHAHVVEDLITTEQTPCGCCDH